MTKKVIDKDADINWLGERVVVLKAGKVIHDGVVLAIQKDKHGGAAFLKVYSDRPNSGDSDPQTAQIYPVSSKMKSCRLF